MRPRSAPRQNIMKTDREIAQSAACASYLESFAELERDPSRRGPSWLEPLRKDAIASFARLGFPTTRDEEWRCTSVAPIVITSVRLPSEKNGPHHEVGSSGKDSGTAGALDRSLLEKALFGMDGGFRLVFLNGRLAPELS